MSFIARKLGLPISTFYLKKRQNSFTLQELKVIVNLMDIDDDDDPVYLEYESKIIDERKDAELMDYEEFKKIYDMK
jgi:hypothetical protein